MDPAIILKAASISFGILGGVASLYARSAAPCSLEDPDRLKRRWYLASYGLTSLSILLFAAIGFV
jgi:hypothetical protein